MNNLNEATIREDLIKSLNFVNDLKEYSRLSISKNGNEYEVMIKNNRGERKTPFFVGSKEELLKLAERIHRLSDELQEITGTLQH